jgi:hypothetical protein
LATGNWSRYEVKVDAASGEHGRLARWFRRLAETIFLQCKVHVGVTPTSTPETGVLPRPYDSFTAGFARARENITQSNTVTNAPQQSIITSTIDAVRDATNDWWNSSDAANAAATTKALSAKIVFARRVKCP